MARSNRAAAGSGEVDPGVADQCGDPGFEPGLDVGAVGDGADWDMGRVAVRPQPAPHRAGDLAMQAADAVGTGGRTQRERREPEPGLVGQLAEGGELVHRHADRRGGVGEVLCGNVVGEDLVAGGNGRVGGEDRIPPDQRERVLERVSGVDQQSQSLELQEDRMALVDVKDGGGDPGRRKCPHAPDAEQQLLADAHHAIAPVEAGRDLTVGGRVLGDVRVEQQQGHRSHCEPPQDRGDGPGRELDADP